MAYPSKRVTKTCVVCGLSFSVPLNRNATAMYCSRPCADTGRTVQVERTCRVCRSLYMTRRDKAHLSKYCSRACRNTAVTTGARPHNYLGASRTANGYVIVDSPNGIGRAYQHRLVAEQMLGRPLRSGEVVHHRDENRANNHPDNLQVMTRAEHTRLHKRDDAA